jgi:hypothetical protein
MTLPDKLNERRRTRAANEVPATARIPDRLPEASFRASTTVADAIRDLSGRRAG